MGMDKKLEDIPIIPSFELIQDRWTAYLEGMQFQLRSEKQKETSKVI